MAHGRSGPDVVMNTRPATWSDIRAMDEHELNRTPDGTSAIDPDRTHLNEILVGPRTQQDALDELFESGVQRPTKQSETPFIQMVLSASPSYFRDEGQGAGEWNQSRLDDWLSSTMKYLTDNFGHDVIHVALHLDEDTPHLHVLIAPTYEKKPRVPGKKKRNETDTEFEARKEAAKTAPGVRTVGRASNEFWKQNYCKRIARQKYHEAVEHLGLGYGKDFVGEGLPSPEHKKTGVWVREQAAELNDLEKFLEEKAEALENSRVQDVLERAALISDIQSLNTDVEKLTSTKSEIEDELSDFESQKQGLNAELEQLNERKKISETELSSLASQKQDLAAQVDEKQKAVHDLETAAHDAERRRDAADADLAALEVLRPAVQAAQALAAIEEVDQTTQSALFDSMSPHPELNDDGREQWALAIRMCDPYFAVDVARHVPRADVVKTNYETLADHDLVTDEDFGKLIEEMHRDPGGPDAVLSLQKREISLDDLNKPSSSPAVSWTRRAFEGVTRGFVYARAVVSEKTVALAGLFESLPSETQSALSRLFRSREGSPEPTTEPEETRRSVFDPRPGP